METQLPSEVHSSTAAWRYANSQVIKVCRKLFYQPPAAHKGMIEILEILYILK